MVASDDDQSPSLQLWDLRNSVSPIREFHGHAKVGFVDGPADGGS
jgi:protein transport protein SEC31